MPSDEHQHLNAYQLALRGRTQPMEVLLEGSHTEPAKQKLNVTKLLISYNGMSGHNDHIYIPKGHII